jgi:hypothetical protein
MPTSKRKRDAILGPIVAKGGVFHLSDDGTQFRVEMPTGTELSPEDAAGLRRHKMAIVPLLKSGAVLVNLPDGTQAIANHLTDRQAIEACRGQGWDDAEVDAALAELDGQSRKGVAA